MREGGGEGGGGDSPRSELKRYSPRGLHRIV